jgi:hypothetical protein
MTLHVQHDLSREKALIVIRSNASDGFQNEANKSLGLFCLVGSVQAMVKRNANHASSESILEMRAHD